MIFLKKVVPFFLLLTILLLDSVTCFEHGGVMVNRPVQQRNNESNHDWIPGKLTTGQTRCFCNLPSCISTGYMCKSASGGCFSNMLHQSTIPTAYKGRHGCLELLTDVEQREWCQTNPGNTPLSHKKKTHPRSLLYCCYSDLCNHVDNPETTNLIDESETLFNASKNEPLKPRTRVEEMKYSDTEVWFKAATIAVPICGIVIVFVLVLLAVRLLRNESNQSARYKLGEIYYPAQTKNNIDYRLPIQKEMKRTHNNPVYVNHVDELQQIRAPLLLQNELDRGNSKNVNNAPNRQYNHSLSELEGNYYNVVDKEMGSKYARSYPEVHRQNLLCDNLVNSDVKNKIYEKKLKNEN